MQDSDQTANAAQNAIVTTKPRRMDGRALRSERTKQLIIEAYLALLRESPVIPTAAQIARRAGYSVRSIFERFDDLLALSFAAADYAFAEGLTQATIRDLDGTRAQRLRAQVETRAGICERWLPLWRVLLHNQNESEHLKVRIGRMRDAVWARLALMYRAELGTLPDARAQDAADRTGAAHRLRELGPHARASRPFDRAGARRMDRGDRPAVAADALNERLGQTRGRDKLVRTSPHPQA